MRLQCAAVSPTLDLWSQQAQDVKKEIKIITVSKSSQSNSNQDYLPIKLDTKSHANIHQCHLKKKKKEKKKKKKTKKTCKRQCQTRWYVMWLNMLHEVLGMSDFASNCAKFSPNGTNLGHFKINILFTFLKEDLERENFIFVKSIILLYFFTFIFLKIVQKLGKISIFSKRLEFTI